MKVTASRFTHEYHFFSNHEIFFDRQQLYVPDQQITDVYGSFWSFLFADIPDPGLVITQGHNAITVTGTMGLLLPPNTIIQWTVRSPKLHWFAYSNNSPYPESFPKDITIYPLQDIPADISPTWIKKIILNSVQSFGLPFQDSNTYAKKLKVLLDKEFKLNKSLQDYASTLGLSKEWLIKYFKKSYSLTPVEYRNKKRMMEALFLLHVEKKKIIDLSQNIGFNDLKHFNQLFKKAISVPPSHFLLKPSREIKIGANDPEL